MQEELATERALRAVAERGTRRSHRCHADRRTAAEDHGQGRATTSGALPEHQPRRRRGRPPKVARQDIAPDDSEIVKWWSPGWQEKYW